MITAARYIYGNGGAPNRLHPRQRGHVAHGYGTRLDLEAAVTDVSGYGRAQAPRAQSWPARDSGAKLGFYAQTLEISGSVCIQWLMPTRSESLATIAGHWTDHPERLSRKGFLAGAPPEAILRALEPRTVPKTVVLGKVPTGFRLDRCAAAPTRQPVRAAAGTKPAAQPCSPRYSGLNH